jgi:MinD superfamily P-loop ATPase
MQIAIASGKGGTGKTTLATGLAKYLSTGNRVVLTDLDVEEPNAGLFISGEVIHQEDTFIMIPEWDSEKCTLCGDCPDICNFNAIIQLHTEILVFPQLCHSCYACTELCPAKALPMKPVKSGRLLHLRNGNLDFVEGRLDIGQEQAVPLISHTIKYVNKRFNHEVMKIFDAPPGTSCPFVAVTKNADFVILVTEPTPFGFHDLVLAVKTMRELDRKFGVVINRDGTGYQAVDEYCKKEHITVMARIPDSRQIAESYSNGNLDFSENPVFSQALQQVKRHISTLQPICQQ